MRITKVQVKITAEAVALVAYAVTLYSYGGEVAALIGGGFWGWCLAILVIGAAFRLAIALIMIVGGLLFLLGVYIGAYQKEKRSQSDS